MESEVKITTMGMYQCEQNSHSLFDCQDQTPWQCFCIEESAGEVRGEGSHVGEATVGTTTI